MSDTFQLPEPAADGRAHAALVARLIEQRIAATGGWIDFAEYMDLALYAPGLGYYSAGAQKFGDAGDFVTAPEISPLFSACIARCCAEFMASPGALILELGAGTGAMAAAMLETLQRFDAVPERYLILEVSADLRARQRALITRRLPGLVDRVTWLDSLPDAPIDGVIVANEVLDALPVSRFTIDASGDVQALGVAQGPAGFDWCARPAGPELAARVAALRPSGGWSPPYTSEVCLRLPAFIAGLAGVLGRGVMLLIDYGLPRRDYYHPDRSAGTLACHYRHRRHADPFFLPGLQDLTAWVDFTAVAEAAVDAGLDVLGFTTQAHFLVAAGLDEEFARLVEQSGADPRANLAAAAAMKTLLMPGEMGENFKVMALGRDVSGAPAAVVHSDMTHRL